MDPLSHIAVTFVCSLLAGVVIRWFDHVDPLGADYSGRLIQEYSDLLADRTFRAESPPRPDSLTWRRSDPESPGEGAELPAIPPEAGPHRPD